MNSGPFNRSRQDRFGNANKVIVEPKPYGYVNTVGPRRQPNLLFSRNSVVLRLVIPQ